MIVPGSTSQSLAASLADRTGKPLTPVSYEQFPDGEQIASVPEFEADHAVIVASTIGDSAWVEVLQLQDAVREAGATTVTTVLPYMGYARQDESFMSGQPVSARAMARAISTTTDRVILVNPHERGVTRFFDVPVDVADASTTLAEPLPSLTEPLFLGPDGGAIQLTEAVRDAYGEGTVDHCEKHRDRETGAIDITPAGTSVTGRDVVLVDDIIATGSTMSESISALKDANRVFAVTVHPLLVGNALTKLRQAGVTRVIGTDTVEHAVSDVSVADPVEDTL
ncbi:MAG: ribose-phosphate pyrophosphokinase [uncultured archaeon A07HR60]|jgi:ribose-phosphate pyrophosphokinase|nr:MAG: ribose-phosphate pyrophosphokinase [uncultured archaeon A07HR60]